MAKGNPNWAKKTEEVIEDTTTLIDEKNTGTIVDEFPENKPEEALKPTEPVIPMSQVMELAKNMALEIVKNIPQQQAVAPVAPTPVFKVQNDINDIPELKDFEMKDRIYVLCDDMKPISYSLAKQHTEHTPLQYTNTLTQDVLPLRYSTNQVSFFIPNQTKEPGSVYSTDIIFNYGMLKVPANNVILQKFLAIHPHNGTRFREYDPSEKSRAYLSSKKIGKKASDLFYSVGDITNRAAASLICPSYIDSWIQDDVDTEVLKYIEKTPQAYIDMVNDPSLKAKGIAKTAISKGFLSFNNYRFINERNEVVLEVQRNTNEFDAIAAHFQTNEGRGFYEFLINAIG